MGNIRSEQSSDFLYDSYNVIGEQSKLKILEQKSTGRSFALREDCFVSKTEYDKAFKRVTQRNNNNQCENVIQLAKIWSKEHTGICSNLYKIFTVYEYPRVKLIDEIEARRKEKKYFEQVQLFSILQSCLNAISHDSAYINLSPYLIFILPQGILKLTHIDLMDSFYRSMFNEQYYYSPEKMSNFQNNQETLNQLEKETIFSLGMTLLHSVLLQSPSFCYEVSMKRFNYRKLEILLSEANAYYSEGFGELLGQMLKFKPEERPTFDQLQISVNDFFCKNDSFVSSTSHHFSEHKNREGSIKLATHQPQSSNLKDASLVYSGQTFFRQNSSDLAIQSVTKKINSELDLLCDQVKPAVQPTAKNVHMMSRTKKLKENSYIDKENLYTDPKLINLIKDGMQKISKSSQDRNRPSLPVINNSVPLQVNCSQPQQELLASRQPFSDYQFCSEPKDKCTFVVQTYEDQSHFEGMLQNKLRNGFGRLTYPDGVYYEGNFKNDTLHGKGSLYYGPNRPAYVGDWVNNKFHGKGTLYNEYPVPLLSGFDYHDFNGLADSWIKYQGQFVQDIKSGEGRIILTNGELMEGTFQKGLLNGRGRFTNMNGEAVEGIWRNNTLILN